MKKQLIRITESDLHQIIKESVKNIIKEGMLDNTFTNWIDIDLYDVDIPEEIDALGEDALPYETVDAEITFREEPYDKGDYYTPPSGGEIYIVDCNIDTDGKFAQILEPNIHKLFVKSVEDYIYNHEDEIINKLGLYDYEHEYDDTDNYKY
jgi:hypothetical protein